MILVDEVGFIERYIFFNVILPVLEVEKTVLLCITSATDDTSWVARITSYRDPQGRPLLFSSNFTGACERCRKLEPVLMMKCTHRRDANPPFKSKSQRRKWGAIYELEGDTDVDMRENYGIITSSRAAAFDGAHIQRFFDPARRFAASDACANRSRVPHVLCCVDPNGASLRNNTAVVIGYYDTVERKVVVCTVDRDPTERVEHLYDVVTRNIVKFRSEYRALRDRPIVVVVEANARFDGQNIKNHLLGSGAALRRRGPNLGRLEFASDNGRTTGINKTAARTDEYIRHMNAALRESSIAFERRICTGNTRASIKTVLSELEQELRRFTWSDLDPDNPRFSKRRRTASGKGRSGNENDDMAVATLMLVYFSFMYRTRPEEIAN